MPNANRELTPREALLLVLDQVDYIAGNCRANEPVGAALPSAVIARAHDALKADQVAWPSHAEIRGKRGFPPPYNPSTEPDDEPLFSGIGDRLTESEKLVHEAENLMREMPTARHLANRVGELRVELEKVAEEFALADHMGTK